MRGAFFVAADECARQCLRVEVGCGAERKCSAILQYIWALFMKSAKCNVKMQQMKPIRRISEKYTAFLRYIAEVPVTSCPKPGLSAIQWIVVSGQGEGLSMGIRSNVRRRRRRRIEELLSGNVAGRERTGGDLTGADAVRGGLAEESDLRGGYPVWEKDAREGYETGGTEAQGRPDEPKPYGGPPEQPAAAPGRIFRGSANHGGSANLEREQDPEKWWKAQQKLNRKLGATWRTGAAPNRSRDEDALLYRYETGGRWSRFMSGFLLRLALAAALFSAAWIWFRSDLPYSREVRDWTAQAVTQDMDFQAVQAWYEQTFSGSPSFLPMFRSQDEAKEVFGGWKRSEAVLPVQGRVVQSYGQDGSGVRIAAPGDSRVKAVYAGRVMQVETDADGKATVLIQHAGKIVTIYGNLLYPEVRAGDWVEAGDVLGSIPPPQDARGESLLYFAVRQNGKTIDPAEVVPFD